MLDKRDITALRKADSVVFRKTLQRSTIECFKKNPAHAADPFAPEELRHDIEVTSRISQYSDRIETWTAFEMIHAAQYSDTWVTIASLIRAGDELELDWRRGSKTTQGMEANGWVGDDLRLLVHRKDRRLTFHITSGIYPVMTTARMIRAA